MRPLALLLLCSCATVHSSWRKHGACAVVCDERMGHMSTGYTVDPFTCRCSAQVTDPVTLGPATESRDVFCCGGCVAEANDILKREPWRRLSSVPFDDPLKIAR